MLPIYSIYNFCATAFMMIIIPVFSNMSLLGLNSKTVGSSLVNVHQYMSSMSFGIDNHEKISVVNGSGLIIKVDNFQIHGKNKESMKLSPTKIDIELGKTQWNTEITEQAITFARNGINFINLAQMIPDKRMLVDISSGNIACFDVYIKKQELLEPLSSICKQTLEQPSATATTSTTASQIASSVLQALCSKVSAVQSTQQTEAQTVANAGVLGHSISISTTAQVLALSLEKVLRDVSVTQSFVTSVLASKAPVEVTTGLRSDLQAVNSTLGIRIDYVNSSVVDLLQSFSTYQNEMDVKLTKVASQAVNMSMESARNLSVVKQSVVHYVNVTRDALANQTNAILARLQSNWSATNADIQIAISNLTNKIIPTVQTEWDGKLTLLNAAILKNFAEFDNNISKLHTAVLTNLTSTGLSLSNHIKVVNITVLDSLFKVNTSLTDLVSKSNIELYSTIYKQGNITDHAITELNNKISKNISQLADFSDLQTQRLSTLNSSFLESVSSLAVNITLLNASIITSNNAHENAFRLAAADVAKLRIDVTSSLVASEGSLRGLLLDLQNNASNAIAVSNSIFTKVIKEINITLNNLAIESSMDISKARHESEVQNAQLETALIANMTTLNASMIDRLQSLDNRLGTNITALATDTGVSISSINTTIYAMILQLKSDAANEHLDRLSRDIELGLHIDTLTSDVNTSMKSLKNEIIANNTRDATAIVEKIMDTKSVLQGNITRLAEKVESNMTGLVNLMAIATDESKARDGALHENIYNLELSLYNNVTAVRQVMHSSIDNITAMVGVESISLRNVINTSELALRRANDELKLRLEEKINIIVASVTTLDRATAGALANETSVLTHAISSLNQSMVDKITSLNGSFQSSLQSLNGTLQNRLDITSQMIASLTNDMNAAFEKTALNISLLSMEMFKNVSSTEKMFNASIQTAITNSASALSELSNSAHHNLTVIENNLLSKLTNDRDIAVRNNSVLSTNIDSTNTSLTSLQSDVIANNLSAVSLVSSLRSDMLSRFTDVSHEVSDSSTQLTALLLTLSEIVNVSTSSLEHTQRVTGIQLNELSELVNKDKKGLVMVDEVLNRSIVALNASNLETISLLNSTLLSAISRVNTSLLQEISATYTKLNHSIDTEQRARLSDIQMINTSIITTTTAINKTLSSQLHFVLNDLASFKMSSIQSFSTVQSQQSQLQETITQKESGLFAHIESMRKLLDLQSAQLAYEKAGIEKLAFDAFSNITLVNVTLSKAIKLIEDGYTRDLLGISSVTSSTLDQLSTVTSRVVDLEKLSVKSTDLHMVSSSQIDLLGATVKDINRDIFSLQMNTSLLTSQMTYLESKLNSTSTQVDSLNTGKIPILESRVMLLNERSDAAALLAQDRHNLTMTRMSEIIQWQRETDNYVRQVAFEIGNRTARAEVHTNATVSATEGQMTSTRVVVERLQRDVQTLEVGQMKTITAADAASSSAKEAHALYQSVRSELIAMQTVSSTVTHLKDDLTARLSSVERRMIESEKILSGLNIQITSLESLLRAQERRLESLESERERSRREYATVESVESVRRLVNDLQGSMIVHSGKVLDLVTAAQIGKLNSNN